MKIYKIIYIALLFSMITSCVDDFQDANPPRLKDGPHFMVTLSDEAVIGGEDFTFSITVIDAPGGIDSIAIVNSTGGGSYTFDNFTAAKGNSTGTITGTYTSPTTFSGKLELDFIVFDAQVDIKGSDASKSATVQKSINVTFPGEMSAFDVNFTETTFDRGSSIDFEIDITSAEGGVDTIYIISNRGLAVIDQTDYDNIIGKESGKVNVNYTSDLEFVGEVNLTVYVVDALQKRVSSKLTKLTARYQFDAPAVTLNVSSVQFKAYSEIPFEVTIDAPGTIESIVIESFEVIGSDLGDTLGTISVEEGEVTEAIGKLSGTVTGTFSTLIRGYYQIVATVTDLQGRETIEMVEVLVLPCDKSTLAGEYSVLTSGISEDDPEGPYVDLEATVTITGATGNNFTISDLSFGLFELQGYDPESGTFITCDNEVVSGSGSSITVISGVINPDGTIEIEWKSSYDDTGYSVLTPVP